MTPKPLAMIGFALLLLLGTACAARRGASSSGRGAAQLWSENCGRCHNVRTPSAYSDTQWEVIALHMRVRANLTAEEHRTILAFLKSSN